jgi:hypothetical protein
MNKLKIILSVIIFTSLIIITTEYPKTDYKGAKSVTETTVIQNYTLKDYNGYIALFIGDSKKPLKVYEILTSSLPQGDATDLKKGITVHSPKELEEKLSDYLS